MSLSFSRRLPVYLLAATVILAVLLFPAPSLTTALFSGETGFIELATVALALWGAFVAARIVLDRDRLPHRWTALWFGLFVVGLVFLAGEEASWGQSWFGWQTPADYARFNRQGETNLHNLSSLSEAIPKTLLLLAALAGGIVWPIVARLRGIGPHLGEGWFGWLWPSSLIWPAAALAWIMRILERVLVATNAEDLAIAGLTVRPLYVATRESIELYAVAFVLAYLWDVRRRMLARPASASAAEDRRARTVAAE